MYDYLYVQHIWLYWVGLRANVNWTAIIHDLFWRKALSVKRLAQLTGLSVATVSRVINNEPSVKVSNREKVLQAIAATGYHPHAVARQLRTNTTRALAMTVCDDKSSIISDICKGFYTGAAYHGFSVFILRQYENLPISNLIVSRQVSGVVSVGSSNSVLIGRNYPIINFASVLRPQSRFSVTVDDYQNHTNLFNEIYSLGFREIGVAGFSDTSDIIFYLRHIARHLPFDLVLHEIKAQSVGNGLADHTLFQASPLDCLVALTDDEAYSLKFLTLQRGLNIPVYFLSGSKSSQGATFADGGIVHDFFNAGLETADDFFSALTHDHIFFESRTLSGFLKT